MTDLAPYPKTRKHNLTKHLIGVPLDNGLNAVCVVLWQSSYFRNLITLGISATQLPSGQYPNQIDSVISLIDTGANVVRSGYWHLGSPIDVIIPSEFSTRICAGNIWCDDKPLRDLTSEDIGNVPPFGCAGMGLVQDYIRFLYSGLPDAKFHRNQRTIMDRHLINYPIVFGNDLMIKSQ
jgi:hypothetical protein